MSDQEIQRRAAHEAHRQLMLVLGVFFMLLLMLSAIVGGVYIATENRSLFNVLITLFIVVVALILTMNITIHDHRTRHGKE